MTRAVLRYLGEMIRLSRRESGMTAQELARRAGISRTTLYNIEKGRPGTDVGIAVEAALAAGVNLFEARQRPPSGALESLHAPSPMFPRRIYENRRPVFDDF